MTDIRDKLKEALKVQTDDMREDARNLLDIIGYRSDRTLTDIWEPQQFLDQFRCRHKGANEREFVDSAIGVGIVFQVGDTEIQDSCNAQPISGQFEGGDDSSFFFVVADLQDAAYSRSRLAQMTRAINHCFNAPAVALFRYAGCGWSTPGIPGLCIPPRGPRRQNPPCAAGPRIHTA